MIRALKLTALRATRNIGVNRLVLASFWRRARLTILCYHGISHGDEHEWNPALYMSPQHFESRLQLLRRRGCTVLPLAAAFDRLRKANLPPRAVCLTFDDGFFDFYCQAWPILRRYSFPATLYLTTYYCEHPNWPVFDVMLSYVLWKSRSRRLDLPGILQQPIALDDASCALADHTIKEHCRDGRLSGVEQHEVLRRVCLCLDFDLEEAIRRRILCLMSGDEVKQLAAEGADIQLHTHRHRVFERRERFWQEIDENRQRIERFTGVRAKHFCYPGGFRLPSFPDWLRDRSVESATTCDAGLASLASDPYLLPRVLDKADMPDEEFDAWVCGVADFLPRQIYPSSPTQLGQEEAFEDRTGAVVTTN